MIIAHKKKSVLENQIMNTHISDPSDMSESPMKNLSPSARSARSPLSPLRDNSNVMPPADQSDKVDKEWGSAEKEGGYINLDNAFQDNLDNGQDLDTQIPRGEVIRDKTMTPMLTPNLDAMGMKNIQQEAPNAALIGKTEEAGERWCCMRGESTDMPRKERLFGLIKVIANVANAAIGSGVLAFPFAFSQSGMALGVIATVSCGIFCTISMTVLTKCARNYGAATYPDLAYRMYGKRGKQAMLFTQILYTFFTLVAYLIVLGTMLSPFIKDITGSAVGKMPHAAISIGVGVLALPLCLMRNMDKLSFTSIIGIFSMLYTCAVIWSYGATQPATDDPEIGDPKAFNWKVHTLLLPLSLALFLSAACSVFPNCCCCAVVHLHMPQVVISCCCSIGSCILAAH